MSSTHITSRALGRDRDTSDHRGIADARLLSRTRLPGPTKVLAAARRRLEAGLGMGGAPLPVDLNPAERDQVGQLFGLKWALSGRESGKVAQRRDCRARL
jgi:hypothetical protein